jgi:hypothetical protein
MPQCQIKWVDDTGMPTSDTNEAIGRVLRRKCFEQIRGRTITFEASDWFFICACHAAQLAKPGMHNWTFEASPIE